MELEIMFSNVSQNRTKYPMFCSSAESGPEMLVQCEWKGDWLGQKSGVGKNKGVDTGG
jgi:hypothetical protein